MDNEPYIMPMHRWTARCTNTECGLFYEKQTMTRDIICPRCHSFVDITDKVVFRKDNE